MTQATLKRNGQPRKRKISSVAAERILREFLDHVEWINANREFGFFVEQVRLFGSHFRGEERVGDVDIAFSLIRKTMGALARKWKQIEFEQGYTSTTGSTSLTNAAKPLPDIHDFSTCTKNLMTNHCREVEMALKNRNPYLDFAPIDTVIRQGFPNKLIYQIPHRDALIDAIKRKDHSLDVEPLHRLLETRLADRRRPSIRAALRE